MRCSIGYLVMAMMLCELYEYIVFIFSDGLGVYWISVFYVLGFFYLSRRIYRESGDVRKIQKSLGNEYEEYDDL